MLTPYAKLIDKIIPPKLEKMFHLGRRNEQDRRLREENRRIHSEEDFRYSQSERRDLANKRRNSEPDERRRRWFKINSFQSRHFSWSPDAEQRAQPELTRSKEDENNQES